MVSACWMAGPGAWPVGRNMRGAQSTPRCSRQGAASCRGGSRGLTRMRRPLGIGQAGAASPCSGSREHQPPSAILPLTRERAVTPSGCISGRPSPPALVRYFLVCRGRCCGSCMCIGSVVPGLRRTAEHQRQNISCSAFGCFAAPPSGGDCVIERPFAHAQADSRRLRVMQLGEPVRTKRLSAREALPLPQGTGRSGNVEASTRMQAMMPFLLADDTILPYACLAGAKKIFLAVDSTSEPTRQIFCLDWGQDGTAD